MRAAPVAAQDTPDVTMRTAQVQFHRRREIAAHGTAFPLDGPADAVAAGAPSAPDDAHEVRASAERLEGVFLSALLTRMREASGLRLFGETPGAQVFEGIFDQMMGDALASRRGIGLYREIERSIRARGEAPTEEAARARHALDRLNSLGA